MAVAALCSACEGAPRILLAALAALALSGTSACGPTGGFIGGGPPLVDDDDATVDDDDATVDDDDTVELPARLVLINEIGPANDSVVVDEALEFDDWFELRNPSDEAVALGGWVLSQSEEPDEESDWVLPTGMTLEAGGYLLLFADGTPEQGTLHGPFRLDSTGELLVLRRPDGTVSDSVEFEETDDDLVYGRFGGDGEHWSASIHATPGLPNAVDPGISRDRTDVLFPTDRVLRFDLALDDANYSALLANTDAHVEGTLTFEGAVLSRVGVSIKGGLGSRRPITQKAALRIDLDEFIVGGRLRGQENLTLNNMVQDPTVVAETLSHRMFRDLAVPAPRVAHAVLYLNGAYRGLYLNVEPPDDQFIQRWFEDRGGNLYEGVYGADVTPTTMDWMDQDEQGADDVDDRSDLAALTELLAGPLEEVDATAFAATFDLPTLARTLAGEIVIGHWDGYFWSPNNYRLYHEPSTGRWTILPWGTDQTFRASLDPWLPRGRIARVCLAVPECEVQYRLALWEVAETLQSYPTESWLLDVRDRILPWFESDPYRETSPGQMVDGIDVTIGFVATNPSDIVDMLFPLGAPD